MNLLRSPILSILMIAFLIGCESSTSASSDSSSSVASSSSSVVKSSSSSAKSSSSNAISSSSSSSIVYSTIKDARDNQTYRIVTIGSQTWMAENLKYLPSVVGPETGSQTTPHYYVYGYNGTNVTDAKATDNYNTYGVLYNWHAVNTGKLCPTGWHVPSDAEWTELTDYLGENAGGKLKATGTIEAGTGLWYGPNTGATNETGFTALPGGYHFGNGAFGGIGFYGLWWSATENDTDLAWSRNMSYNYSNVSSLRCAKEYGFSVRCVADISVVKSSSSSAKSSSSEAMSSSSSAKSSSSEAMSSSSSAKSSSSEAMSSSSSAKSSSSEAMS
ncbi:MAG TPA: fibrobacter succinogenes major paralogous domain-containing protein, partial [Flavobacterium sp.]|nr:fibrobacter succinogenes major paralogous domain-containing protein [Flavobacterium sp.]